MRFKGLGVLSVSAVLGGLALAGCSAGSTTTVIQPGSSASSGSTPSSSTTAPARPQIFHGTGQQNLGTIVVPSDSTISWNCPSCGNTNFIINNAKSDDNSIATNGLNQTQGVDPIPAGVYHTVVVDTTGGPWTVAIGTTAPPPNGAAAPAASGSTQCDPNVSVSNADCPFAENTFYEYWSHHGVSTFSVYSPTAQTSYTVNCSSSGEIACTTDQGASVTFSQSSIAAYTQGQANAYARSHNLGP